MRILSQEDFRSQYQALATVDSLSSFELRARILILTLSVIGGYFAFEILYPLIWLIVYCALLWVQHALALRVKRRPRRGAFWGLVLLNFCVACVFLALPVALWSTDHPVAQMASMALSMGAVLHSFAHRARMPLFALGDATANSLFIGFVAMTVYFSETGTAERGVILLIVGCMIFYYFSALFSVFGVRSALQDAMARNGETQKMHAIGQLTRGVAHDFNNILTVVLGNLELYHQTDDPKERDVLANEAHVAAGRASVLTKQLLAFSRQSTLVPVPTDLGQFLHDFSQMAQRVIPGTVDYRFDVPRGSPLIHVDQALFEMAMLNLVLNARDAMPDGGRLRIHVKPLIVTGGSTYALNYGLPAGQYAMVTISDTGVGIPSLIQNRVFDPFFTTKAVGDGSGLGLSMARGFAEQSAGALLMDSRPGVGTVLSFILPATDQQADQAGTEQSDP